MVGGIAGFCEGVLRNVAVDGTVEASNRVGGVVGYNGGTVREATVEGTVRAEQVIGGVVGDTRGDSTIEDVRAENTVVGEQIVGGIVAENKGRVESTSRTGEVRGDGNVGGIVGLNRSRVVDTTVEGSVTGDMSVGGLVGHNKNERSELRASESSASVTGEGMHIGGLLGHNEGTVRRVRSTGSVQCDGSSVGGIVGKNGGELSVASSTCEIRGETRKVGGVAGSNDGTIRATRAVGDVLGTSTVGGLVGHHEGELERSFAADTVFGDRKVGGCVGELGSAGFGAADTAVVRDCYVDGESTGLSAVVGAETPAEGELVVDGVESLDTTDCMGTNAAESCRGLEFDADWTTRTDPDDYPQLQALTGELRSVANSEADAAPEPASYGELRSAMDGDGSEADPYVVTDVRELQAIAGELSAAYRLGADIDAGETATWNGGEGFEPIGSADDGPFTGSFDGAGHTISGLSMDRNSDPVGLFGSSEGALGNVELSDTSISGFRLVGGLVGRNAGEVSEVSVDGTIDGDSNVGAIAGETEADATIEASTVSGTVTGEELVGGVTGVNRGTVADTDTQVTVDASSAAGGIAGGNIGTLRACSAAGTVDADSKVGGLTGGNDPDATVENCTAECTVDGDGQHVGGAVGYNQGTLDATTAKGDVSGMSTVGGLAGANTGTILQSAADGPVSGQMRVGGLVGSSTGRIEATVAIGAVSGMQAVGGLLGKNGGEGAVQESVAAGDVEGMMNASGGLVGRNYGGLYQCLSQSAVGGDMGMVAEPLGGIAGTHAGHMEECLATGELADADEAGGLVGAIPEDEDGAVVVAAAVWATDATGRENAVGTVEVDADRADIDASGRPAAELRGTSTRESLAEFDFEETWERSVDPDGYPRLAVTVGAGAE